MAAGTRISRTAERSRDPRWVLPPLRVERSECLVCDRCVQGCPDVFGAIVRHGVSVEIVPELCSGCGRCVAVCPVDCIVADPAWSATPDQTWRRLVLGHVEEAAPA